MKQRKFHLSALILFLAIIVAFTFAGRSINNLPGRPGTEGVIKKSDPARPGNRVQKADPVKEDIEKINRQYGESFAKGDSSLFLQCYTPDACILAANAPILCEQRGLSLFYKAARRTGVRNVVFTSIGLYGQTPEYVTEQGTYEMFDAGQNSLGRGKFLVVWKKTGEGWKMFRDMFNSDAPPAPAH